MTRGGGVKPRQGSRPRGYRRGAHQAARTTRRKVTERPLAAPEVSCAAAAFPVLAGGNK
jgi:hypothetical protein